MPERRLTKLTYSAANWNAVTNPPGGNETFQPYGAWVLPPCNGSNQPCLDTHAATGPIGGATLERQFAASGFAAAKKCCWTEFGHVPPFEGGQLGNGDFQVQAWLGTQNTAAIFTVYDPNTATFIAGRDSLTYYPITYGSVHSVQLRRGLHVSTTAGYGLDGPVSGADLAGNGPYRLRTTSAMTSAAIPAQPGGSPIPANLWAGGAGNQPGTAQAFTVTVDGGLCDPSPYSTTINVTGIAGSTTLTVNSGTQRLLSWITHSLSFSGNSYVIDDIPATDGSILTLHTPLLTSPSSVTATFLGEPPDSGVGGSGHCGHAGDFFLKDPSVGDILFRGVPSSTISYQACQEGAGLGYESYQCTQGANKEALMVLAVAAGPPLTLTLQGAYEQGSSHHAGNIGDYLYADSGNCINESGCGYDFPWDFIGDPTGALGLVAFDTQQTNGGQIGHGWYTDNGSYLFVDGGNCPVITPWTGTPQPMCIQGRYGANLGYVTAPNVVGAFGTSFAGQTGSSVANSQDMHPASYFPSPAVPASGIDGRVWNGDTNNPAIGTANVDGHTGVWRYTAAQRGCSSPTQCLLLDKILAYQVNCGSVTGFNQSGPSASITSASPNCAFATVRVAGEGTASSQPGDLIAYAPNSEGTSVFSGIANAGDHIDVGGYFAGAWMAGFVREAFQYPSPHGEYVQWLGHVLARPRRYTPYLNGRPTPDNLCFITQIFLLDGVRDMDVLGCANTHPLDTWDSVPRNIFISQEIDVPPGKAFVVIDYGYASYADPTVKLRCNWYDQPCNSNFAGGDPYLFSNATQSPTPCSSGCKVFINVLSGEQLYYRLRSTDSSGNTISLGSLQGPFGVK